MQVEAEGDVATAFTLARILSDIPLSRGGPASVVIFDIHALQVTLPAPQNQTICTSQSTCMHAFTGTLQGTGIVCIRRRSLFDSML